jgi:ferritin-like metal-binding protein YciE
MKINNLNDLLVNELKDLYDAEHRIVDALKKMASKASSAEVRELFEDHRAETLGQIERLDQVFKKLGVKAARKTCEATKGLITEAEELTKEIEDEATCDAGLIASAQKVEHYEMAGYGAARTWARLLGHEDCAKLLQATLDEEAAADEKLSAAAEKMNEMAR